jgi:uncharacterized protein (TIGR03437 family)
VAIDASGNVAVYGGSAKMVQRFGPDGKLVFSKTLPTAEDNILLLAATLAMDPAGNTYVTRISTSGNYAVKNTVAACGAVYLTVFSPAGDVLQSTWIAGAAGSFNSSAAIAVDASGGVFALDVAEASFTGTRSIETSPGPLLLTRFSTGAIAKPLSLACITDAALFHLGPVAPGEIVTLFGNGLGPAEGSQAEVTPANTFPSQWADVTVSFDGHPAPLLYVQDSQINTIVPWSVVAGNTTEACVSYKGTNTNCLTLAAAQSAPVVFRAADGYAAALNEDGTINSAANPAKSGSIVSIFATGLGPISPAQADGAVIGFPLPVNALPVTAEAVTPTIPPSGIPPIPLSVTYAGPAPLEVAGFSQINVEALLPFGFSFLYVNNASSAPFRVHIAD